ncbi:DUF3800 domain-containing protein [Spiroplasma endosymbiont of Nebria brevicollis]|uniref:DUF3800 domain-containing protein n=1 Tax=Spiroplasma endosymbiont of Nebria brevicollis TaxID=3066284 RepID=UPI00313F053E
MNNNTKNEYWIFIDDSGNIELTDKSNYFIYSALLFSDKKDIKEFRINFEKTLISLFGNNNEVKGADRIPKDKRNKIHNCIINSNCKLFLVVINKNNSYTLEILETQYKNLLELSDKSKKSIRTLKKYKKKWIWKTQNLFYWSINRTYKTKRVIL